MVQVRVIALSLLAILCVFTPSGCIKYRRSVQPTTRFKRGVVQSKEYIIPIPEGWEYRLKGKQIIVFPTKYPYLAHIKFESPAASSQFSGFMRNTLDDIGRLKEEKIGDNLTWKVERVEKNETHYLRGYVTNGKSYIDFRAWAKPGGKIGDGLTGDIYQITRSVELKRL